MRNSTVQLCLKMPGLRYTLHGLLRNKKGQDLVEYALVLVLIALAAAAGMNTVAQQINAVFTTVGTKVSTYTS
jgi:pilus assembly protein Flp/PilA